jgi:hypothetical protein
MHYLLLPAALALGWVLVYLIWIRPLRAKIAATVPSIVEPAPNVKLSVLGGVDVLPPTAWQKFVAAIEGWKTIGLSFILSVFATATAVFNAVVQNTSLLDDFQSMPWASVFKPDVALKIVSALLVIVPIFHLVGKVKAAMATPVSTGSERADGP